jgi:hypothetical protein
MTQDVNDPQNSGQKVDKTAPIPSRNSKGQWVRGSGGGGGRKPRGARHKATLIAEAILARDAKKIFLKAVEVALGDKGGPDRRALMSLIAAPLTSRPMSFQIPPLKNAADALLALDALADAIRAGEVTESEAQAAARVIATAIDAIKPEDLAKRIQAIEDERKQQ